MRLGLRMGLNSRQGGGGDLPSLDLAFALDKTLTPRKGPMPDFTRVQATSTGSTYVGVDGLIKYAAANEPRFDHDPATGDSKGLLIEEPRTNLATYSADIVSGIGWFTNGVVTAASGTGADGNTSYSITESATDSTHFVSNTGGTTATGATSIVSGTNYTGSIFVKKGAGSADWVQITLGSGGFGTSQYANFNIGSGTVGNSAGLASGIPPRIEEFPNGWYRCIITVTANATVANSVGVILSLIGNTDGTTRLPTYLGNASNSVLSSLCQLEAGAFPTSYIPTTSGTAIRSADVCSIVGTDFSSFYNQSEGTLFAECEIPSANQYAGIAVIGATSFNHNIALFKSDSTGGTLGDRFVPYVTQAGTLVALHDFGAGSGNGLMNVAASVALNNMIFAKNGTISPADLTAAMPTPNRLTIGARADGNYLNGHIARIQYFRKRLSNAKLQTLTAP
jgi:hypothetical protein